MNDYISVLQDSIGTSVSMNIFTCKKSASFAHIFNSTLVQLQLCIFTNVDNFNPNRLQPTAKQSYPVHDRPRGNRDIDSVLYYQTQLQQNDDITPIWLIHQNNKYVLLDGAHRIVASYIEGKSYINAYVIDYPKNIHEL